MAKRFIEELTATYKQPYLFNAKERDEETGLHYFRGTGITRPSDVCLDFGGPKANQFHCAVSHIVQWITNPMNIIDPDGRSGESVININNKQ